MMADLYCGALLDVLHDLHHLVLRGFSALSSVVGKVLLFTLQ